MVSRCVGLSAVAAAAYLSCSRLYNDYDGIQHDCSAELGLPYGYKTEPVSQTDIQDAVLALIRTYAQCAVDLDRLQAEQRQRIRQAQKQAEKALTTLQNRRQQLELLYIAQLPPGKAQEELAYAIRGKGAFRRFKQSVRFHGLEQRWYDYLAQAYRDLAIRWCAEEGLEYTE